MFLLGFIPLLGPCQKKKKLLKIEIERLQKIIHKNILNSRQHYIKLDMPNMYKNLLNSSIKNDYSMGFNRCLVLEVVHVIHIFFMI